MKKIATLQRQHGIVTIFVSMILLLLITLMVITAYSLSTTNLRAVGNVQARDEAIAAANSIIEKTISFNFWEQCLGWSNSHDSYEPTETYYGACADCSEREVCVSVHAASSTARWSGYPRLEI